MPCLQPPIVSRLLCGSWRLPSRSLETSPCGGSASRGSTLAARSRSFFSAAVRTARGLTGHFHFLLVDGLMQFVARQSSCLAIQQFQNRLPAVGFFFECDGANNLPRHLREDFPQTTERDQPLRLRANHSSRSRPAAARGQSTFRCRLLGFVSCGDSRDIRLDQQTLTSLTATGANEFDHLVVERLRVCEAQRVVLHTRIAEHVPVVMLYGGRCMRITLDR